MSQGSNGESGGVGCLTIMFLIFLTLKLTGTGAVAGWSWWAVTAPLWVPAVVLFFLLTAAVFYVMFRTGEER